MSGRYRMRQWNFITGTWTDFPWHDLTLGLGGSKIGVSEDINNGNNSLINIIDGRIEVNSSNSDQTSYLIVYDTEGNVLFEENYLESTSLNLNMIPSKYFIVTSVTDNKTFSKKFSLK